MKISVQMTSMDVSKLRILVDLVFTDFAMPGMNGHQLAAAIKASAPDQPVIMITGHAGTLLPSPDVDFVVSKPFGLENLREAIAKVLPAECRTA